MFRSIAIRRAESAADFALARQLFREYAQALGVDLCFQGFDAELQALESMYGPPAGCLLLAGDAAGCVAVRDLGDGVCEMKRLYVRPAGRGSGLGRALAEQALAFARTAGYRRVVLDTLPDMAVAQGLYRDLGFSAGPAYYSNPLPGVIYLTLNLDSIRIEPRHGSR
ncbi:MAG: GNAT family N-acetyltransferase [Pseudomonadota bacterium]